MRKQPQASRLLTTMLLLLATVPGHADEAASPERFAARFAALCLRPPLDLAGIQDKLQRLGTVQVTDFRQSISATVTLEMQSLRESDPAEPYIITLDVSEDAGRHQAKVACGLETTAQMPLDAVLQAFSRVPELGPPNANDTPSIVRTDAIWFHQLEGQPVFISLVANALGKGLLMVSSSDTFHPLPPAPPAR